MPRRGGNLRPMVMTLANLSRPGYRFRLSSQQHLFLYESLSYSTLRLASSSTESQSNAKPDPEILLSGKTGKPGDTKGSTLFSPTPSKPAPPSASASSPSAQPSDHTNETSASESKSLTTPEDKSVTKSKEGTKPEGRLTKTWAWIKREANHYWDGTKLLAAEVRVSSKLLRKVLNGARLTRRERRQVSGTYYTAQRVTLI
jgi:LETM1 and EF-hand domain-containing protein 1